MSLEDIFAQFGYTPSPEEAAALGSTFQGKGGDVRGTTSVADYVNAVKTIQNSEKNDPLNNVIKDERGFFNDSQRQAADYEGRADATEGRIENTLNTAPKLFGSLTPDQIDSYLAPLRSATDSSNAVLAGDAARRGLAGSSTEFNSLSESERLFKQNVLATGLQVGQNQQQSLVKALQQYMAQQSGVAGQFRGFTPGSLQRQGQIAGQQSTQRSQDAQYLSELPIALRGVAANEYAISEAVQARQDAAKAAKRGGVGKLIGTAVGAGAGALTGNPMLIAAGAGIGGNIGGDIGSGGFDFSSMLPYLAAGGVGLTALPLLRGSGPTGVVAQGPEATVPNNASGNFAFS